MILFAWRLFLRWVIGVKPKAIPPVPCPESSTYSQCGRVSPLCIASRCFKCCGRFCSPKCGTHGALSHDEVELIAEYRTATKRIGGVQ